MLVIVGVQHGQNQLCAISWYAGVTLFALDWLVSIRVCCSVRSVVLLYTAAHTQLWVGESNSTARFYHKSAFSHHRYTSSRRYSPAIYRSRLTRIETVSMCFNTVNHNYCVMLRNGSAVKCCVYSGQGFMCADFFRNSKWQRLALRHCMLIWLHCSVPFPTLYLFRIANNRYM